MQLTQHFTLAELTKSSTAERLELDNTPPPEVLPALTSTAEMLERIRSTLGVPVTVTSGYRAWAVNKAVGGVTTSDHTQGRAAVIVAPRYGSPLQIARALAPLVDVLGIGQLIYERFGSTSWVHVSTRVPDKRVNRVITITSAGTQLGVQEV